MDPRGLTETIMTKDINEQDMRNMQNSTENKRIECPVGYMWNDKECVLVSNKKMDIKKLAKDISTLRAIQMLWDYYKHNIDLFSKKLGELIRRNQLSFTHDKEWIMKELKKLTGENWLISQEQFKIANSKDEELILNIVKKLSFEDIAKLKKVVDKEFYKD